MALLGREHPAEIQIPSQMISARHAEARLLFDGRIAIRDLGSTNGTYVNGERVAAAEISATDELVLADTPVDFAWLSSQLQAPSYRPQVPAGQQETTFATGRQQPYPDTQPSSAAAGWTDPYAERPIQGSAGPGLEPVLRPPRVPFACPHCGRSVPPGAGHCGFCGYELFALGQYPAPPSRAERVARMADRPFAGFWLRFLAYWIDSLLVTFFWFIAAMLFFGTSVLALSRGQFLMFGSALASWFGFNLFAGILVLLVYYPLFESSSLQGTPGKLAVGLVVTDIHGRRVTYGRALGRNLGKYLSGLLLGIGFLCAAFSDRKQALHDMMAACLVWKKRHLVPSPGGF